MAEKFEIDQVVRILQNDFTLSEEFVTVGFPPVPHYLSGDTSPVFEGDTFIGNYPLSSFGYLALVNYYFDNQQAILNGTAEDVSNNTTITSPIWTIITDVRSTPYGYVDPPGGFTGSRLAHLLIYSFKYSSIKLFFRKNYRYFLPDFDYEMINSQEKVKLAQEAYMREFDKFSTILENLGNVVDIDKVQTQYLAYLGQIIGYEREDYHLLTNSTFRELLKNIIEIYKIKGTNYSFELFFNLLGFEILPKEFYFDKRYGDTSIAINLYTSSTDKNSYLFYMTPTKPTDYILDDMAYPYAVNENDMTPAKDLDRFNYLTTRYILGDSVGYAPIHLTGNTTINLSNKIEGYWLFNEGQGDTIFDSSKNRYTARFIKNSWAKKGVGNSSQLYFPDRGDTRFVYTLSDINLKTANAFTLTFIGNKSEGDSACPINFGFTNTDGFYILAYNDGSGIIRFNRAGNHEDVLIPTGVFDNVSRYYALTYQVEGRRIKFYKDSILIVNSVLINDPVFPNRQLFIGDIWPTNKNNGWVGTIEEVRLYSRALTEYEIKEIFSPITDSYTFFKTNVIQYSIASLATGQEPDLTASDLESIDFYATFLSPIFIKRSILFTARPSNESASSGWQLSDLDRTDPFFINTKNPGNRFFPIQSIDARAGDTFHSRGIIVVSDLYQNLINFIHPSDSFGQGKLVLDKVQVTGTSSVSNDGFYTIAGDTQIPFYNSASKQTTIYVRGDTDVGIHGSSKASPTGYLYIGGPDRMMHLYSGYYPDRRYWEYNKFERDQTIPGGSELLVNSLMGRTSNNRIPRRVSPPYYMAPTYGTTANTLVKFTDQPSYGYFKAINNAVATARVGDTSKWNVWSQWFSSYGMVYDPTIGDTVFQWSPGLDGYKTIIGDTNKSPGTSTGQYFGSFYFSSNRDVKISFFFNKIGDTSWGDTITYSASQGWTLINTGISTITAYNGFGWWIKPFTGVFTVLDSFKIYRPQVEFAGTEGFARPFALPPLRLGDSLTHSITVGDSGSFACWVKPYFNFNTSSDRLIFSDYGPLADTCRIVLKFNSLSDKWTFTTGKDKTHYRTVSSFAYSSPTNSLLKSWNHLKVRWNAKTGLSEMWVNGIAQHSDSSYANTFSSWKPDSTISLGGAALNNSNLLFDGLITDAIIYNYADGDTRHFGENTPWIQSKLGTSGYHISGFYDNTREMLFDPSTPNSVFSTLKAINPNWSDEQVYAQMVMIAKTSGDTAFTSTFYKNKRNRDLYLLVDSTRNMKQGHASIERITSDTRPTGDSYVLYKRKSASNSVYAADSKVWWRYGGWLNVVPQYSESTTKGTSITLGSNFPLRTWDNRPNERYYQNFNNLQFKRTDSVWRVNTGEVFGINPVSGQSAVIYVRDKNKKVFGDSFKRFKRLTKDDYITLYSTQDPRNDLTRRVTSVTFPGDTTIITVYPYLPGSSQTGSRGYIDFEQVRRVRWYSKNTAVAGKSRIALFDGSRLLSNIRAGDTFQIIDRGDSTEGTYYADSVGHARLTGDSGITTIIFHPQIVSGYGDSYKGMVRMYGGAWSLGQPNYTFMQDKIDTVQFQRA